MCVIGSMGKVPGAMTRFGGAVQPVPQHGGEIRGVERNLFDDRDRDQRQAAQRKAARRAQPETSSSQP